MDRNELTSPGWRRRSLRGMTALVAFVLVSSVAMGACSMGTASSGSMTAGAADASMATVAPTPAPVTGALAGNAADMIRPDAAAAWAARPDFVRGNADTEAAYEFALYHPNVVEWMPCYCGCVGMGHRSNLDCYLKPEMVNGKTQFEEHASYCDVCVKTTLLTKQMISQGKSLREIRAAVDSTFGGNAPGTNTALPPA
jgi:hypothetical protein